MYHIFRNCQRLNDIRVWISDLGTLTTCLYFIFIQMSLSLWNTSPGGYSTLRNSGMIYLPSESLLRRYKNCIQQKPGINADMFKWLYTEANRLKCEKNGGLIIDEMSVQEDLQIGFRDGKVTVDGFVHMGQMSEDMNILNTHSR